MQIKKLSLITIFLVSTAFAVCPPLPIVSLTSNPSSVQSGGTSDLTWSSANADSCTASGSWTGIKSFAGLETVGPIAANSSYTLICTNIAGSGTATANVTVQPPPPPPGSNFGLEWPGDAHLTNIRRMLYWVSPPPAFPMTYIFQVYPRKKTNNHAYFTTFFWGTNGPFDCDWNYYGAHPYPVPAPSGPGRWESGSDCSDETAPGEVEWNRWFQQAVTSEKSGSHLLVSFYYDLPDTTKLVQNNGYLRSTPPNPAIVMGQSPDDGTGKSWGGYDGWEEFNGIIRGIQIYTTALTTTEIAQEIQAPMSTAAGFSSIWYLNLNPRPTDVTDKKGVGTPHNPLWEGTTALEATW